MPEGVDIPDLAERLSDPLPSPEEIQHGGGHHPMRFIVEPMNPGEQQLTQRIRRTRRRGKTKWAGALGVLFFAVLLALANNLATLVAGSEWMP